MGSLGLLIKRLFNCKGERPLQQQMDKWTQTQTDTKTDHKLSATIRQQQPQQPPVPMERERFYPKSKNQKSRDQSSAKIIAHFTYVSFRFVPLPMAVPWAAIKNKLELIHNPHICMYELRAAIRKSI